jgi:DNA invertase Pin-like site-specific DNA recombinase
LKRAALVVRVSTGPQITTGTSPESQFLEMWQYADRNDLTAVAVIVDVCSGTTPIRERPGGSALYHRIDHRQVDVVVFYAIDRVARDEDVIELITLRRDCREAEIELHYATRGRTDLSTLGGVVDYVGGAVAAEERKAITERTTRGKRRLAASGTLVCDARPPYGFRKVGMGRESHYVPVPEEIAVVLLIYALFLGQQGHARMPLRAIAEELNRRGITSPGRGKGWHVTTVKVIISNPAYAGEFRRCGMLVRMPELAMIDRETYDLAQRQLKLNSERSSRNRHNEYLMSGHIRCACGRAMCGLPSHARNGASLFYYRCSSAQLGRSIRDCNMSWMNIQRVDGPVWDWLCQALDPDKLRAGLARLATRQQGQQETDTSVQHRAVERIEQSITRYERQMARLAAILRTAESNAEADALQGELRAAGRQLDGLRADLDQERMRLARQTAVAPAADQFVALTEPLRARMPGASFGTRRFFVERLDVGAQVRVDENGAALKWLDVTARIGGGALPTDRGRPFRDRRPGRPEIEYGCYPGGEHNDGPNNGRSVVSNEVTGGASIIVLSASIPLDGQPPTTLADELFIEAAPWAAHHYTSPRARVPAIEVRR